MIKGKIIFLCTLVTFGMISGISHATNEDSSFLLDNVDCTNKGNISSISSFNEDKKDRPIIIDDGGNVSYARCVNCGKLNTCQGAMPQDKICSYCGLPINTKPVMYEYRNCVNCRTSNKVLKSAPSSTLCTFCEDPIGTRIYRCFNCHSQINYSTYNDINGICPNCNYLANGRVWKCTTEGCPGIGVMQYKEDYNNTCPWCDEYPCIYKLCINCDYENEIYYNYKGEEATYSGDEIRIRGDKCLNCGKSFKKSSEYTVFETTLQYRKYGENHPIKGCKVYFRNQSGSLTRYATSNEKGYVRIKLRNSEFSANMLNFALKASPQSEGINVLKENDYSPTGYSEYGDYTFTYFTITENSFGNINNQVSNIIDTDGNSNNGMAVLIGRDALIARKYAKDMLEGRGITLKDVKIIYPATFDDTDSKAYYFDHGVSKNTIFVHKNWKYNERTILHEYGHHIQGHDEIKTFDDVFYNGGHYGYENHIERFLFENKGKRLAWGEGWPNAFADVARNYYFGKTPYSAYSHFGLEENDSMHGFIIDRDTGDKISNSTKASDGVEDTIEQILWDLFDGYDSKFYSSTKKDDIDGICLGYKEWFDSTTKKGITTLKALYDELREKYPNLKDSLQDLFAQHSIFYEPY